MSTENKIWGGRIQQPPSALMDAYGKSIHFDCKLFDADITVNRAWALALADAGILSAAEAESIRHELAQIQRDYHAGKLAFSPADEDIHSANERWLTERLGDLGARIHTGRSRNDQVATDVRLYLREAYQELQQALTDLLTALVTMAEEHVQTAFPGQTHLRQAQPISWAHYLLAFFFQLQRDQQRLMDGYKRCNYMPLGSGAIAGAAFPIDRHNLARELGFTAPSENSYDATADRDVIIEMLYGCSQIMTHLSRLAEDFIIWSSEPYGYIEIDESYTTGSSMMPQKKNPDSLELLRGKSARVIGHLVSLLMLMKGIPTAYVRDLQEDKEPLFDAVEQTVNSIRIATGVVSTLKVDNQRMVQALDAALYATDLADYLVKKGMPFRQAHHLVGAIVAEAEHIGVPLDELTLQQLQTHSELFNEDVHGIFDPQAALGKRNLYGGTGPESVRQQIDLAKKYLGDGPE